MKVQIKDLKPNPFRDIKNYPINEEKVQSLTNSINQTGFWDNILARKNNGNIEIAYGHHRLVVLRKLFKPDDYVDIPVKELDDSTMIRIMANENISEWDTSVQIINETIKVTKKFLEEHPEIVKGLIKEGAYHWADINKLSKQLIGSPIISRFLGGNWTITRVRLALERLGFGKRKDIDIEATEIFDTEGKAITFVKVTKQINTTSEQQREAAKRIIEKQDFSESGMKSALLDEKYKDMKTEKSEREKVRIKARDFVHGIAKDLEKINEKIVELIKRKSEPNFDVYEDCIEAEEFTCEVKIFISNIKKLGGKK